MINVLGEALPAQATRPQGNPPAGDKGTAITQPGSAPNQRPVENSSESTAADSQKKEFFESTTRHTLEDGEIIFERYNASGELIQKIPPGYVPISEVA